MLDRGIPAASTALLVAGVLAAALRLGRVADYIFVLGLLFQFAISFENWWRSNEAR
jgi:hypothetical protein